MEICIETLKAQHPDFSHHLYDISDCRAFLRDNFEADVLEAYDTLIPYSYKSDLWRFCVLYIHGGIYLDSKFQCVGDFRFTELLDKEYYANDLPHDIAAGILVSRAGNPLLMVVIKEMVKNISLRFYGNNPYDITGPSLLGRIMNVTRNLTFGESFSFYKDGRKILEPYGSYFFENIPYEHYTLTWNEKRVYKQNILMLVAHPDDEILFGYNDIIGASSVTIVCFTSGGDPIRSAEFFAVVEALGVKGIMLDYEDSAEDVWDTDSDFFSKIPLVGDCIISHDEHGDYGNLQHMRVHKIAKALAQKRSIPYRNFQEVKNDAFRDSLINLYVSQKHIVETYRHWSPLIKITTKHWFENSGKSI